MSNIKKQYVELVEFLEANKGKKISSIIDEVRAMCEAKKGGSDGKTFEKDEEGNVVRVFCWYHKEWEDVATTEYGTKKGTATGLNTMCKQGVSAWTKQQRVAKQAKNDVLNRIMSGELTTEEAQPLLAEIEDARTTIIK